MNEQTWALCGIRGDLPSFPEIHDGLSIGSAEYKIILVLASTAGREKLKYLLGHHYDAATDVLGVLETNCAGDKVEMADPHLQQFTLPPSIAVHDFEH